MGAALDQGYIVLRGVWVLHNHTSNSGLCRFLAFFVTPQGILTFLVDYNVVYIITIFVTVTVTIMVTVTVTVTVHVPAAVERG